MNIIEITKAQIAEAVELLKSGNANGALIVLLDLQARLEGL